MINLSAFIKHKPDFLPDSEPWFITSKSEIIISSLLAGLGKEYHVQDGIAVHQTAIIEPGAVIKPPCIIGPNCFIAAGAYLRGGVWLEANVIIGPACEIKSSFICKGSKAAHFNFVGDSIIGRNVNIEAGAIIANYRNELDDKIIQCRYDKQIISTGVIKFGALLGDETKIGANAVLAPGTLLKSGSIIRRLELIDQSI